MLDLAVPMVCRLFMVWLLSLDWLSLWHMCIILPVLHSVDGGGGLDVEQGGGQGVGGVWSGGEGGGGGEVIVSKLWDSSIVLDCDDCPVPTVQVSSLFI